MTFSYVLTSNKKLRKLQSSLILTYPFKHDLFPPMTSGFFPTESGKKCVWEKECFEYHFQDIQKMTFKLTPEVIEGLDWCMRKEQRLA
jgi:hypothetical protein